MSTQSQEDFRIEINRTFQAPRQMVWDAWTQSEQIAKWWGPEGMQTRVEKNEFYEGGDTRFVMVSPDGKEYPAVGKYKLIQPIEKIVTSDHWDEEYAKVLPGVEFPDITEMTILFEDKGEKTDLQIIITHPSEKDRELHNKMGATEGWMSSFNKLDVLLAGG